MRCWIFVLALLVADVAGAADWVRGRRDAAASSTAPPIAELTQAEPIAYFIFTSADSTTTTGPVLKVRNCGRLEVTTLFGAATAGVKLYESDAAVGSTGIAVATLPQITSDFDNDGVSDSDALDQLTIEKSGLRDFMADGIVPAITAACSTGTCKLKVQCGSAER